MATEATSADEGQGQVASRVTSNIPLVFLRESDIFGNRRPTKDEWLSHTELYQAISTLINESHIEGLQRVRGMWRIYLDNIDDKVALMSEGVPIRGKVIQVLNTNPDRLDSEQSTRIRIKNIPLSVDDGIITRTLTLRQIEVINSQKEKLRVNGKLTNCSTGDRLVFVKTSTLDEPLPHTMQFGQFIGRVIHPGQLNNKAQTKTMKCTKCHEEGHRFGQCTNEWVCNNCKQTGHKQSECPLDITKPKSETSTLVDDTDNAQNSDEESDTDDDDTGSTDTKPVPQSKKSASSGNRARSSSNTHTPTHGSGQSSMDRFVSKMAPNTATPNTPRASSVTERSPPTPVEVLQERVQKKKKHKCDN